MARGVTLKHIGKAGAISDGQLVAKEIGFDTTNKGIWVSFNGTTVFLHSPVKTLTDGATVSIDVSDGTTRATLTTGNSRTLDFTAAGAYDMQVLTLRIDNSSGSSITPAATVGGTNDIRFGDDFTAFPTIPANDTAYLTFIYHLPDTKWDYLGDTKGF